MLLHKKYIKISQIYLILLKKGEKILIHWQI